MHSFVLPFECLGASDYGDINLELVFATCIGVSDSLSHLGTFAKSRATFCLAFCRECFCDCTLFSICFCLRGNNPSLSATKMCSNVQSLKKSQHMVRKPICSRRDNIALGRAGEGELAKQISASNVNSPTDRPTDRETLINNLLVNDTA